MFDLFYRLEDNRLLIIDVNAINLRSQIDRDKRRREGSKVILTNYEEFMDNLLICGICDKFAGSGDKHMNINGRKYNCYVSYYKINKEDHENLFISFEKHDVYYLGKNGYIYERVSDDSK